MCLSCLCNAVLSASIPRIAACLPLSDLHLKASKLQIFKASLLLILNVVFWKLSWLRTTRSTQQWRPMTLVKN
ncbi:hypothetical protein BDZ97DRAFT_1836322 [Flammula alnicola]|nr:hypothetical protein BDZ97DRAFT_1836322 [Flammula alnicola]